MALRDQAISPQVDIITGTIENWEFVMGMVWGNIYGDVLGRFSNGQHIRTSRVLTPEPHIKTGEIIKTKNSYYLLGKEKV